TFAGWFEQLVRADDRAGDFGMAAISRGVVQSRTIQEAVSLRMSGQKALDFLTQFVLPFASAVEKGGALGWRLRDSFVEERFNLRRFDHDAPLKAAFNLLCAFRCGSPSWGIRFFLARQGRVQPGAGVLPPAFGGSQRDVQRGGGV